MKQRLIDRLAALDVQTPRLQVTAADDAAYRRLQDALERELGANGRNMSYPIVVGLLDRLDDGTATVEDHERFARVCSVQFFDKIDTAEFLKATGQIQRLVWMTSALLRKRLEKLTPPSPPPKAYIAPLTDPAMMEQMKEYLEHREVSVSGSSRGVQQAMNNYLSKQ